MSDYYSSSVGVSTTIGNSCTSTRWLTEEVFALIDLVQRNEAIYNPRHKYYFCRPYVENFWREVDLKLEKNPGASLAKWTNLRISFRREYTNYLEEKIPPCWTYFDRMFFLHPFLRKKHQQPKSLDSQVQDALVQISSLSNRLQRERAAAAAYSNNNGNSIGSNIVNSTSPSPSPSQPHQLDNYLEYLDEGEPNTSELDDIIDEDERTLRRRHFVHSILVNDIKSECEDNVDDYETEPRRNLIGNTEEEAELDPERDIEPDQDQDPDDHDLRNFILNTIGKRHQQQQQQQQTQQQHTQQRLHHLQRLQTRTFYEEFRAKRAKSQDGHVAPSTTNITTTIPSSSNNNITNNISLVRPTFAKPSEIAGNSTQNTNNISNTLNSNDDASEASISERASTSLYHGHFGHNSHNHHHHQHTSRFEFSTLSNNNSNNSSVSNSTTLNAATAAAATVTSIGGAGVTSNLIANSTISTPELCDCKTDPDAMFLMSLLPDIQKLNGRDRGKIKIAFQNILQDYLYPD